MLRKITSVILMISILATLFMASIAVVSADTTTITFDETFPMANVSLTASSGGTAGVVTDGTNKVLQLTGNAENSVASFNFANPDDYIAVEFDMKSDNNGWKSMNLLNGTQRSVALYNSGTAIALNAHLDGTTIPSNVLSNAGRWINYKIYLNQVSKKINILIDNAIVVKNGSYKEDVGSNRFTSLQFGVLNTAYFDNIKISTIDSTKYNSINILEQNFSSIVSGVPGTYGSNGSSIESGYAKVPATSSLAIIPQTDSQKLAVEFSILTSGTTGIKEIQTRGISNAVGPYLYINTNQFGYKNISGTYINLNTISANKWYQIKMIVDLTEQKADILMDGQLIGRNIEYRSPITKISNILFNGATTGTDYIGVDCIKLYETTQNINSKTLFSQGFSQTDILPGTYQTANNSLVDGGLNGKAIQLTGTGYTHFSFKNGFSGQTVYSNSNNLTVEYKVKTTSITDNLDKKLHLMSDGSPNVLRLTMSNDKLKLWTTASASIDLPIALRAAVWYNVKIVTDFSNKILDVYVDGVKLISKQGFFAPSTTLFNRVSFDPMGGTLLVDEVTVNETTENTDNTYVIKQDFENVYSEAPLGMFLPDRTGGTITMATEENGNKAMKFTRTQTTGNTGSNVTFPSITGGVAEISLSMKTDEITAAYKTLIINNGATGIVSSYIANGNVGANYGITVTPASLMTAGKWFDVKLLIDLDKKLYDMYVNSKKTLNAQPFRADTNTINKMYFSVEQELGTLYVDNICVSKVTNQTVGEGYTLTPSTIEERIQSQLDQLKSYQSSFEYGKVAIANLFANENIDTSNTKLVELTHWLDAETTSTGRPSNGECDFVAMKLIKAYYMFQNDENVLYPTTKQVIKDFLLTKDFASAYESENHRLVFNISKYLAGQLFQTDSFTQYNKTGAQIVAEQKDILNEFIQFRAKRGWGEFDSSVYMPTSFTAILNLYDYTTDTELKNLSKMMLDIMLSDMAVDSIDGIVGGASGRVGDPITTFDQNTLNLFYTYFNTKYAPRILSVAEIEPLISAYRPSEMVTNIATSRAENYVNKESKHLHTIISNSTELFPQVEGNINKYTYYTNDYIIGANNFEDAYPTDSDAGNYAFHQQHDWDLALVNDPSIRIFTHHPGVDEASSHTYWSGDSGCGCGNFFANKNVVLATYDIPSSQTNQFIHMPISQNLNEKDTTDTNYIFLRKGNVYIGVYFKNGYSLLSTVELKSDGAKNAVVCEVATSNEYASFQAFKTAMKNKIVTFNEATMVLTYDNLYLSKTERRISNKNIDLPYETYNSPYTKSLYNTGLVELKYADKKVIYDFINGTISQPITNPTINGVTLKSSSVLNNLDGSQVIRGINGDFTAKLVMENAQADKNATMSIGLYKDNKLVDVFTKDCIVSDNTITENFQTTKDIDSISIFLWEQDSNKPIIYKLAISN